MTARLTVYLGILVLLFLGGNAHGSEEQCQEEQSEPRQVLFIGNSYTFFWELWNLVKNLSEAAGKTIDVDEHTEGGWTWADVREIVCQNLVSSIGEY